MEFSGRKGALWISFFPAILLHLLFRFCKNRLKRFKNTSSINNTIKNVNSFGRNSDFNKCLNTLKGNKLTDPALEIKIK